MSICPLNFAFLSIKYYYYYYYYYYYLWRRHRTAAENVFNSKPSRGSSSIADTAAVPEISFPYVFRRISPHS